MSDPTGGTVRATVTGILALTDGGVWTVASMQIATFGESGLLAVAAGTPGAPTTLEAGSLDVGIAYDVHGVVATPGVLDVTGGSLVTASQLGIADGASITIDSASSVVDGGGAAVAGALVVAGGATVEAGDAALVGNLDLNGVIDAQGITLAGTLTGSGTLSGIAQFDGGVSYTNLPLVIGDASTFAGTIELGAPGPFFGLQSGELVLESGDAPDATLVLNNGTVDLQGVAYAGQTPDYDAATGLLTVGAATLDVGAGLSAAEFTVGADSVGGTLIVESGAPCFASGTSIATARGAVMVQHLRIGELVLLAGGGTAPVTWLGHRRVDCRRHPRPDDVRPVRVAAHAFGWQRPHRDLLLSPDHAVFIDGVLIPVRYLLNGATLRQEDADTVTYWHVELPSHGVLLAEGLPAESYLDTGNRGAFANAGTVVQAAPAFAREVWERAGCARLVTEGAARDGVYRRMLAQALSLGWQALDAGGGASRWQAPRSHATSIRARNTLP